MGGTPFNQAASLVADHKDKWAIVSGMNLPLVIEALSQRFTVETAKEIAQAIVPVGNEGIKIYPEVVSASETKEKTLADNKKSAKIPEGTVLGDGKDRICFGSGRYASFTWTSRYWLDPYNSSESDHCCFR